LNSRYKATVVVGTTLINATADIFEKNRLPAVTMLVAIDSVFERGFKNYFTVGKLNSDTAKGFIGLLDSLPKDKNPPRLPWPWNRPILSRNCAISLQKKLPPAG